MGPQELRATEEYALGRRFKALLFAFVLGFFVGYQPRLCSLRPEHGSRRLRSLVISDRSIRRRTGGDPPVTVRGLAPLRRSYDPQVRREASTRHPFTLTPGGRRKGRGSREGSLPSYTGLPSCSHSYRCSSVHRPSRIGPVSPALHAADVCGEPLMRAAIFEEARRHPRRDVRQGRTPLRCGA